MKKSEYLSKWTLMPIDGKNVEWEFVVEQIKDKFDVINISSYEVACTDGKGALAYVVNNVTHVEVRQLIGFNIIVDDVIKAMSSCNDDTETDLYAYRHIENRVYFYSTQV